MPSHCSTWYVFTLVLLQQWPSIYVNIYISFLSITILFTFFTFFAIFKNMASTRKHLFAPSPQTLRGQPVQLTVDPKGEKFVYTNGRSVFIRDLANPSVAIEYSGHAAQATVARFSPSGYYIASGDIHGNVRIWDTVNPENILKSEIRPIAGRINDIAWDGESKRIIAVGEGKEHFGRAFFFDSLSSCGEIFGHLKQIQSVSIRHQRPFRAVTGSDDNTVVFYTGVPFKFQKTIKDHSRFVHGTAFSPNGEFFVTVGADAKIFLYDGKEGEKIAELSENQENGHKGSIFAVSWSSDGKYLLTSSADRTAKIWDVEARSIIHTYEFSAANSFEAQQVGNLWAGDHLITLSLSGDINYLDFKTGKIRRTIRGHQKAITTLAVAPDNTFFTGSYDGAIYSWPYGDNNGENLEAMILEGQSHTNLVNSMVVNDTTLFSSGYDDVVRVVNISEKRFTPQVLSTGAQPKSIAISSSSPVTLAVATVESIQTYKDLKKLSELNIRYTPSTIAINSAGDLIAVGDSQQAKIYVYTVDTTTGTLTKKCELSPNSGAIISLAMSNDSGRLAAGSTSGNITVYDLDSQMASSQLSYHTARVNSLAWSKNNQRLGSGSLDMNVIVWNVQKPNRRVIIKNTHIGGVNGVAFLGDSDSTLVTTGSDATVKIWNVFHDD